MHVIASLGVSTVYQTSKEVVSLFEERSLPQATCEKIDENPFTRNASSGLR